jgi:hypothetical protein
MMEPETSLSISEESGEDVAKPVDHASDKESFNLPSKHPYPDNVILSPVSCCGKSFWKLGALNVYMLACAFLTLFMAFSTIQVCLLSPFFSFLSRSHTGVPRTTQCRDRADVLVGALFLLRVLQPLRTANRDRTRT